LTTNPFASKSDLEKAFFEENKPRLPLGGQIAGSRASADRPARTSTDGVPVPELATIVPVRLRDWPGVLALRKSKSKVRLA